eukprot:6199241-Pleurochrysis_carterae.AAC.1
MMLRSASIFLRMESMVTVHPPLIHACFVPSFAERPDDCPRCSCRMHEAPSAAAAARCRYDVMALVQRRRASLASQRRAATLHYDTP